MCAVLSNDDQHQQIINNKQYHPTTKEHSGKQTTTPPNHARIMQAATHGVTAFVHCCCCCYVLLPRVWLAVAAVCCCRFCSAAAAATLMSNSEFPKELHEARRRSTEPAAMRIKLSPPKKYSERSNLHRLYSRLNATPPCMYVLFSLSRESWRQTEERCDTREKLSLLFVVGAEHYCGQVNSSQARCIVLRSSGAGVVPYITKLTPACILSRHRKQTKQFAARITIINLHA